jgi:hypothetical protein
MTEYEYKQKYAFIAASMASTDIKEEALAKLSDDYYGAAARAMDLIAASAPEPTKGDE